jgi:thiol-disulfide isomerase/thioredoxin
VAITKIVLILFFLLFLSITALLFYKAFTPDILPLGSNMPEIDFRGLKGQSLLNSDSAHVTIVVFFRPGCGHCRYLLDQFNSQLDKFKTERLFFLTLSKDERQFRNQIENSCSRLVKAQNVWCGFVEDRKFTDVFGKTISPTIYIFNQQGKLVKIIHGLVKLDTIKSFIHK